MIPEAQRVAVDAEVGRQIRPGGPQIDDVSEAVHAALLRNAIQITSPKLAVRNFSAIAEGAELPNVRLMQTAADRLKWARERAGYETAKSFADAHGIPQGTYANHESGGRGLREKPARRYARLLDVSAAWLLTGDGEPHPMGGTDQVEVVGHVEAGKYKPQLEWGIGERYTVQPPQAARFAHLPRYGLEVRGESMNLAFQPGTVIICVPIDDFTEEMRSGQRVVVKRVGRDTEDFEYTVKELVQERDGTFWLWPRSTHPEHQQPLRLDETAQEADGVEIVAIVVGSYRDEVWD